MNLNHLEKETAGIVSPAVTAAITLLSPYQSVAVSASLWYSLLVLLYSIVEPASTKSAELSRMFYDSQREKQGLPQHPIPLAELSFERFAKDMDEAWLLMRKPESSQADVEKAALRVARSVENSGRWTMMRANNYPDPAFDEAVEEAESITQMRRDRGPSRSHNLVKGWARVATGRETCGWCMMLVSRGPIYSSAGSAGSKVPETDAVQLSGAGELDVQQHMHAWHTGCDCKVVPVFNLNSWEGRDRYLAAAEMWKQETRGYFGKDAINALRRAVYAGKYQGYLEDEQVSAA